MAWAMMCYHDDVRDNTCMNNGELVNNCTMRPSLPLYVWDAYSSAVVLPGHRGWQDERVAIRSDRSERPGNNCC